MANIKNFIAFFLFKSFHLLSALNFIHECVGAFAHSGIQSNQRQKGYVFMRNNIMESLSPPTREKYSTSREKLFATLQKSDIGEKELEFFLSQKGILPSNLQCMSPKTSCFLIKHWDSILEEYYNQIFLNI